MYTDLLPLVVLALVPVALMLQCALHRSRLVALLISLIGYMSSALLFIRFSTTTPITPLITMDSFGCFYSTLITFAALAIALLSYSYLKKQLYNPEEYYLFLSLATLGATILTLATHFASFFLGLETLTVALYALIAYKKTSLIGLEAALKYLILAGLSSAFLLFGLALLYLETGTMAVAPITTPSLITYAAIGMLLVGIGFKLAVFPFSFWTPDIYQGAPSPVTAFIATVSKGAVFVFLLRFFTSSALVSLPVLSAMAIASMVVGNLLALLQTNLKRLLAYSSIAHIGYLLVAFLAGGTYAQVAVAFYLTAYFITTLGAFGVITALSDEGEDLENLSSYSGLIWRHPLHAVILALMMFSLAGLPVSAGFMGKWYILWAGVASNLWLPVAVLIFTSILGLSYYLRVIITLFAQEEPQATPTRSLSTTMTLIALTLLLLWLGVYPSGIMGAVVSIVK